MYAHSSKSIFRHAQPGHQVLGDGLSLRVRLIRAQHHFQFHEFTQPLHLVQVDAGLANQVQGAHFADNAPHTQGETEGVFQAARIAGFEDGVIGAFGTGSIRPFVIDQLTVVGRKLAQFQASFGRIEKCILLRDHLGGGVAECLGAPAQVSKVAGTCFDFNVCWHAVNSTPVG